MKPSERREHIHCVYISPAFSQNKATLQKASSSIATSPLLVSPVNICRRDVMITLLHPLLSLRQLEFLHLAHVCLRLLA